MFTIIGGDGKEYGPVTADQIRHWISGGRANLDTKAKAAGSEEWRRLAEFTEFAPPASMPPPVGSSAPVSPAAVAAAYAPHDSETADAELASVGARTGAAALNAFLYFISLMPGAMLGAGRLLKEFPELMRGGVPNFSNLAALDPARVLPIVIWVYAGLGVMLVIQFILLAVRGQNIGQIIAGVRVVKAEDGARAGVIHGALLRFLVPLCLFFLLMVIPPLNFLFVVLDYSFIFRADRRCIHDFIAGTKVVKA